MPVAFSMLLSLPIGKSWVHSGPPPTTEAPDHPGNSRRIRGLDWSGRLDLNQRPLAPQLMVRVVHRSPRITNAAKLLGLERHRRPTIPRNRQASQKFCCQFAATRAEPPRAGRRDGTAPHGPPGRGSARRLCRDDLQVGSDRLASARPHLECRSGPTRGPDSLPHGAPAVLALTVSTRISSAYRAKSLSFRVASRRMPCASITATMLQS